MLELPDDDAVVKTLAHRYAAQQWLALAGAAWRSYMAHGRGAFLVPWGLVAGEGRLRLAYVSSLEPLASEVSRYDPRQSVVLAFVGDAALRDVGLARQGLVPLANLRAYWFAASLMPAPPDAARALPARAVSA
jgi:hypothetical protein